MRFRSVRRGAILEVTFDDGGMNLLSSAALRELETLVLGIRHGLADIDPPSLLLFRSGRPGLFAAGADMAEMERFSAADAMEFAALGQELFGRISVLPMATAAFIDGDCFGGALDLALAFDVRLAAPSARFAHPGARLNIVTGFGGTSRWRQRLSFSAARRLFLANEVLSAAEALSIGLVDSVSEEIDEECRRLLQADPRWGRMVKELTIHSPRLSQRDQSLLADRLAQLYSR
ncbi:MAG TPA: enoyl-CoA hydratase/isomerase family protein [Thermoanaerobaculia bacterium]|nr:enoyl-CoA hydratase/isomerase family protein [Thermoanaerobaculia bacterium]